LIEIGARHVLNADKALGGQALEDSAGSGVRYAGAARDVTGRGVKAWWQGNKCTENADVSASLQDLVEWSLQLHRLSFPRDGDPSSMALICSMWSENAPYGA
jgi:hypothetical protein